MWSVGFWGLGLEVGICLEDVEDGEEAKLLVPGGGGGMA